MIINVLRSEKRIIMREGKIYVLKDPDTDQVRYVGVTFNLKKRIAAHFCPWTKDKSRKTEWVRELKQNGKRPVLAVIDSCTDDNWEEKEKFWIKNYLDAGSDLFNWTPGGNVGGLGYKWKEEAKEGMRIKRKGIRHEPERLQNISIALQSKMANDPEYKNGLIERAKYALSKMTPEQIHTREVRRMISIRKKCKTNLCLYYKIKLELKQNLTHKQVAQNLNVTANNVRHCIKYFK